MVQIIEEAPRNQKFAERLLQGVGNVGEQLPKFFGEKILEQQKARENEQLSNLTGMDLGGIQDPAIKREIVKQQLMGQGKQTAKVDAYKKSQDLINRARDISRTGHLGSKVGILGTGRQFGSTFSSKGRRLRAEYQQIGKALVQAAAPLKITNRAEFQHYAKDLEDPTRNLEDIQGSLDALERIIRMSADIEGSQPSSQTERPPLSSFHR